MSGFLTAEREGYIFSQPQSAGTLWLGWEVGSPTSFPRSAWERSGLTALRSRVKTAERSRAVPTQSVGTRKGRWKEVERGWETRWAVAEPRTAHGVCLLPLDADGDLDRSRDRVLHSRHGDV